MPGLSAIHAIPSSRWGAAELSQLSDMLQQDTLFYWRGRQTKLLVERFREHYPLKHVMPCSSGTAALHAAVAAAGIGPGDEVIVPPLTDMGTVIGVLYQQGVPVFADLMEHSYDLDPAGVRRKITPRTRAIIAVHLAGNPCRIKELRSLADEFDLVLIEDCAQAWGASLNGRAVGLFGHIACYSFNDFKHLSCGDGGVVASSDDRFGAALRSWCDKGYDRMSGSRQAAFLAPNYRISEPQSAVAAAQLERLIPIAEKRNQLGERLSRALDGVPGISIHEVVKGAFCSYWFYMFRLGPGVGMEERDAFVERLSAEGIPAGRSYLEVPLYRYPVFLNHQFFAGRWPVREMGLTEMDYNHVHCEVAEAINRDAVRITIHESMTDDVVDRIAESVTELLGES